VIPRKREEPGLHGWSGSRVFRPARRRNEAVEVRSVRGAPQLIGVLLVLLERGRVVLDAPRDHHVLAR
jgi:hypothetical protein